MKSLSLSSVAAVIVAAFLVCLASLHGGDAILLDMRSRFDEGHVTAATLGIIATLILMFQCALAVASGVAVIAVARKWPSHPGALSESDQQAQDSAANESEKLPRQDQPREASSL